MLESSSVVLPTLTLCCNNSNNEMCTFLSHDKVVTSEAMEGVE